MNIYELRQLKLAPIYKKLGVPVSCNGLTAYGFILNEPTDVLQLNDKQYAVSDTELSLTIITGSLGNVTTDTPVTVNGVNYKVYKPVTLNDGLEIKYKLMAVE